MSFTFLEKQSNAFLFAKMAIIFQTVLTLCIGTFLVAYLNSVTIPLYILTWLLCIDVVFVVTHLSYRGTYRGPRVILKQYEKKILLVHVISSLFALITTFLLVRKDLHVGMSVMYLTLLIWGLSLFSGVAFFRSKYSKSIPIS